MAKAKKQAFSVVKAVKENARERVGPVPPERVIPDSKEKAESRKTKHKETLANLLSKTGEETPRNVELIRKGQGLALGTTQRKEKRMAVVEQQKAQVKELKPTPEAEALYRRWIAHLNEEFTRGQGVDRRSELVRDELYQIYLGRPHGGRLTTSLTSELASSVLVESLDPRNITLKAEYLDDLDQSKFLPRKPLIFFWRMFDRSPLGLNRWLGVRVRCMLAQHIFTEMGKGVKISSGVQFTLGYNLRIEDNAHVGEGAVLDDRKPLVIPAGTVIADGGHFGNN